MGESEVRENSERYKIILIQFLQLQTTKHSNHSLFSIKIHLEPKLECSNKTVSVNALGQVNGLHKIQGLNQIKVVQRLPSIKMKTKSEPY